MRIESTNKIYRKDIPEAPSWLDKLLDPLNRFMDSCTTALRGRLTFYDNFYCEIKEFEFTHGVEQRVSFALKTYSGVILIKGPDSATAADRLIEPLQVRTIDNLTIGVTARFGGTSTGKIKFIILG